MWTVKTNQTGWMPRLIGYLAGLKSEFVKICYSEAHMIEPRHEKTNIFHMTSRTLLGNVTSICRLTQLMRLIYDAVVKICTNALSQFSGSKFFPHLLSLFPFLSFFILQQVL